MTANVEAMVREGINAYRAGKKGEARALLLKAVELDQYNEDAWLWLSATVDSPEEARTCLENVLVINPNNEKAKKGIAALSSKSGSAPAAPKPAAPAPAASGPFGAGDDDDEMPSSLEWDLSAPASSSSIPTSSASAALTPQNEPSSEDYDSWVSGLNLGGAAAAPSAPAFDASPFSMDDSNPFGFDEDELEPAPPPARSAPPVASSPVVSAPSRSVLDDDDGVDDIFGSAASEDDVFGSADDDLFADDGGDFFGSSSGGDEPDPQEYFRHIPAGIAPTRLPGTNETYPAFVPVGIGLLVVLNVVAIAALFLQSQG